MLNNFPDFVIVSEFINLPYAHLYTYNLTKKNV